MASQSGPIRKQLGPAAKRLSDRVKEASSFIQNKDVDNLRDIRSKLKTNIEYYEKVSNKLYDLVGVSEDEQKIVDGEIEKCTELLMDANEIANLINETLDGSASEDLDKSLTVLKVKEAQKIDMEIENLKLEGDVKRAQLEKLKTPETSDKPNSSVKKRVKLPTIGLPEFNGDVLEWTAFWDSFSSTVHLDDDMPKVEKFKYLKSCLTGEAKDVSAGFSSTAAQYDQLVEYLKERYDDETYIIHTHYTKLSNLERSDNSTKGMRKTFNIMETQLRSLESLGENVSNHYMVATIKSKFSEELNLKLEETRVDEWTTGTLRKAVNRMITARERSEEFSVTLPKEEDLSYSSEGLLSTSQVKCYFCSGAHWSDDCQRFKTVNERKAQVKGKCFICFNSGHQARVCTSQKQCFHCKKKNSHHSSICPDKFPTDDGGGDTSNEDRNETGLANISEENCESNEALGGCEEKLDISNDVVMKTVRLMLRNTVNNHEEPVNALLDIGSKRTYVTSEKSRKLKLNTRDEKPVNMNTFGSQDTKQINVRVAEFMLKLKDGKEKKIVARVCDNITGPVVRHEININKYQHIWKGLNMAKVPPKRFNIDFLLGGDYYEDIMQGEKIMVAEGLYLVNSTVGWMFSGRVEGNQSSNTEEGELGMIVEDRSVEKFWDLESVGIDTMTSADEDAQAMKKFNSSVRLNANRYVVPWLWKFSKYELSSNYNLCESRLKSLYSSKQRDDIEAYDGIIRQQLSKGYIEEADSSDEYKDRKDVVLHYLPHHMVKSAEKKRIVYEGCAKSHRSHKSLNECLYRGKNMVADLCGTLVRFRIPLIAVVADIEKAYLQLELEAQDRDTTRFLWLKNIRLPPSKDNIWELRFRRVIWGIVTASFLLAATIAYHLNQIDAPIAQILNRDLYIDNLVSGMPSCHEAVEYYKETKRIFNAASMNMCKWSSNSAYVMTKVESKDKNDDLVVKVLGMRTQLDELRYPYLNNLQIHEKLTKRTMRKYSAGIFDPAGYIGPALLKPKLLIQRLYKEKIEWDDRVPNVCVEEWNKWYQDMAGNINDVRIKRCVNASAGASNVQYELVVFTDASVNAYAAVAYLRVVSLQAVEVNLIFSKIRLCPIKPISIPRLELLGVLIGCRIINFLNRELGIEVRENYLFTDSICVIEWYKSRKKLKRFVQNKMDEIHQVDIRIGYVKSKENPGDVASRGSSLKKLIKNEMWWKGPRWLMKRVIEEQTYKLTDEILAEIRKEERNVEVLHEVGMLAEEEEMYGPFNIKISSFSAFHRLVRVTAWCLRFVNNCIKKSGVKCGPLHLSEIQSATLLWDRCVQAKSFPSIFQAIIKKQKHSLQNLGLVLNKDGVLVCKGRIQNAAHHYPKLLPKKSNYTQLVMERAHKRVLHAGVSQSLVELRKEYWVLQGRSAVRKVVRECLTCIRWEGGPFKTPDFAPLPGFVVSLGDKTPFAFTGLDYLGPILVKENAVVVKVWGCLFTCLKVRAVHLEIVETMSAESFLLSMRRFIGRRGKPRMIVCDNAGQFKLGCEVIGKVWNNVWRDEEVQSYVATEGIEWKWVTEYSPWKGGFYERLVGIAKRGCKKALGKCMVSKEQLATLMVEIEAIMNSRPLLYVNDDVGSGEALTPGHFLSVNCKHGTPNIAELYTPDESSCNSLLQSWRIGQTHLDMFWKIWSTEYMQSLRETHTANMKPVKGEVTRVPEVGEVVTVKEDNLPRGSWKLARIESLIKSSVDGVHRAAVVITSTGKTLSSCIVSFIH